MCRILYLDMTNKTYIYTELWNQMTASLDTITRNLQSLDKCCWYGTH